MTKKDSRCSKLPSRPIGDSCISKAGKNKSLDKSSLINTFAAFNLITKDATIEVDDLAQNSGES